MKLTHRIVAITSGVLLGVAGLAAAASAAPPTPWTANTGTTVSKAGVASFDTTNEQLTPYGTSLENTDLRATLATDTVVSFEYLAGTAGCGGGQPRLFVQGGAWNSWDTYLDCGEDIGGGWFRIAVDYNGPVGPAGHSGLVVDNTSDRGTMQIRNLVIGGTPIDLTKPCKGGTYDPDFPNQGRCMKAGR